MENEPTHINYKYKKINRHQSAPQHHLPALNLYGNRTPGGLPGYSTSGFFPPFSFSRKVLKTDLNIMIFSSQSAKWEMYRVGWGAF